MIWSLGALLLSGLIAPGVAAKSKFNYVLSVGSAAPAWKDLPGVDGKSHSLVDLEQAHAVVVVFTCNTCRVTKMYEERLLAFARKYEEAGVALVAINVNRAPADSLEKMKERAAERKYSFPYLYDDTQEIARAYGATVTPHFFLLDIERKIAYMGAFDDNFDAAKVQKPYLTDAVDAVLTGKAPPVKESLQRGCAIQYE